MQTDTIIPQAEVSKAVRALSKRYRAENNCTNWDINNGLCDDFAGELIELLGGYREQLYELSGDMFFNVRDPEFALANWGKTTETKYGVWSDEMLENWGLPKGLDIKKVNDEINHVWVFANGKHYDAECPNGVDHWYEIPLINKFLIKFI